MTIQRAKVISNLDPKNLGRVKFRFLKDTEEEYPDEVLFWAEPINTIIGSEDSGSFVIPPVGAIVCIILEESDYYKPFYFGSWSNTKIRPKEAIDYNKKVLYKSPTGHTIILDDTPGEERVRIIDRLGQIIEMYSPSKDDVDSRGVGNVLDGEEKTLSDTPNGMSAITIKGLGNNELSIISKENDSSMNIICSGTVNLVGKQIKFNNGDGGMHTSTTIPYDTFTGKPLPGLPHIKAP